MIPTAEFTGHLRDLAAHVAVVTATDPHGLVRGLTVTTVVPVTAEPPVLGVCLSRTTSLAWVVRASRRFSVSLLAHDQQEVADTFAGRTDLPGPQRFDVGTWTTGTLGGPVLAGAVAAFECTVEQVVERSTHDLVLGLVQHAHGSGGAPLVHHRQSYGTLPAVQRPDVTQDDDGAVG